MKKALVEVLNFTGTAEAVEIMEHNPDRAYLSFYAQSGASVVSFSGTANGITIAAGQVWEPEVVFTNPIYHSGDGSTLLVLTSNEPKAGVHFPLEFASFPLGFGDHTLTF